MLLGCQESLGERDIKRKCSDPPSMRKSKRRKLEKLTGWGEASIHLEKISSLQEDLSSQQEELTSLQEEFQPQRNEPISQEDISVHFKLKEPKQTSIKEWALPGVVVMLPEEENGKEVPATTTTTTTTGVVVMLAEEEEGKEVSVSASTTTTATAEGRKRKAEVLAECSKSNFVFNKRRNLKDDEIKELERTNRNIYRW